MSLPPINEIGNTTYGQQRKQTERKASARMVKARGMAMSKERDAEMFVTACLAGELGEDHQRAAEGAVTVAEEHGFVDDAGRVAAMSLVKWSGPGCRHEFRPRGG